MLPSSPSTSALWAACLWLLFAAAFLLVAYERAGEVHRYELAGWVLLGVAMVVTGTVELLTAVDAVESGLPALTLSLVLLGVGALLFGRRFGGSSNASA